MSNRRSFLKLSASIGGALGLSPLAKLPLGAETLWTPKRKVDKAPAPLNILILGGTGFTGPEQVDYAIARGHRVTLFNRGKTRPGVFKGKVAEELIGDADKGAVLDAGLIGCAQAVEHYEIARYGTLSAWAEQLKMEDAVELLEETLEEEEATDEKLSELALSGVNAEADEDDADQEDEDEEDKDEKPAKRKPKAKK